MQTPVMAQRQQARAIPVQIQASAILGMNAIELGQFIDKEAMENPALAVSEQARCPLCGFLRGDAACPICGTSNTRPAADVEKSNLSEREHLERAFSMIERQDGFDPFRTIASTADIRDHLGQQARMALGGRRLRIAEFLIDSLDEDGYFRESLYDTAEAFAAAVPEIESVLQVIQGFDPPGIGARDLRECLLLQLLSMEEAGPEALAAQRVLTEHWEDFSKVRFKSIAAKMGVSIDEVRDISDFIRENLTPHPASLYRAPYADLAPTQTAIATPDVIIRSVGDGFVAEVVDRHGRGIDIDETYNRTYHSIRTGDRCLGEEDSRHVKEQVERVRCILDAINLRKKTLARVATYLAEYQRDFIAGGPMRLRPLRQKDMAKALGLHESTICRALANKYCQMPNGDVISFEVFFDSALPVRTLISQLVSRSTEPMSDGDIARKLENEGVKIARRTVAKYRDQLRMLPFQLRAA
jgi:RNA polymerase sigma-54 factor